MSTRTLGLGYTTYVPQIRIADFSINTLINAQEITASLIKDFF